MLRKKYNGGIVDDDYNFGVTTCLDTDLDADLHFIGTESGVVNLDTGKLLPPEQGRKHLVTRRAPCEFQPDATHPDVERLFAHLPDAERRWWWRVLGYALRGAPSARIYEVIGPAAGGKSGLMAAITATLGPYAGVASPGLLEYRRGAVESDTGLSPGTVAMVPPRRFAIFDEVKPHRLNNKLIKDWSGDGAGVTWRTLHREPRTDRITATMFLLCNTGQEARLGMQDVGMQRRLRTLRYPAIPPDKVLDDFNTKRVHDPAFQRALLWRLVSEAASCTTGSPPEAPPTVMESTAERISDDVGEIGIFSRRFVRCSGTLTVAEVWSAWCEHNEEPETAEKPGGISRRFLSTVLRDYVEGLPKPKQLTVRKGKNARGWRGWRLLDQAPDTVSDETDEIRFRLPDGSERTGSELQDELRQRGSGWVLVVWADTYTNGDGIPSPAPGAKWYAVIERGSVTSAPPLDTDTVPLFPKEDGG